MKRVMILIVTSFTLAFLLIRVTIKFTSLTNAESLPYYCFDLLMVLALLTGLEECKTQKTKAKKLKIICFHFLCLICAVSFPFGLYGTTQTERNMAGIIFIASFLGPWLFSAFMPK